MIKLSYKEGDILGYEYQKDATNNKKGVIRSFGIHSFQTPNGKIKYKGGDGPIHTAYIVSRYINPDEVRKVLKGENAYDVGLGIQMLVHNLESSNDVDIPNSSFNFMNKLRSLEGDNYVRFITNKLFTKKKFYEILQTPEKREKVFEYYEDKYKNVNINKLSFL